MLHKIKLRLFVFAVIAIMMTMFTQETLAYYATVGTSTNVITSGSIRMVIHEMTDQGTPYPTEGVYIVPGDVVSKQVSIENDCEHPFYLRVKPVYSVDSQSLSAEDCFKLNIDQTIWQLHDGWYYYNGIVQPGQTTPDVFSYVEIVGSEVDNRYLPNTLSLTVVAQAVQSENNPITDNNTFTAFGWPAE